MILRNFPYGAGKEHLKGIKGPRVYVFYPLTLKFSSYDLCGGFVHSGGNVRHRCAL